MTDFANAQGIGAGNLQRWVGLNEVPDLPPTPRPVSFVPIEVIPTPVKAKRRPKHNSPAVVARIVTGAGKWRFSTIAGPRR